MTGEWDDPEMLADDPEPDAGTAGASADTDSSGAPPLRFVLVGGTVLAFAVYYALTGVPQYAFMFTTLLVAFMAFITTVAVINAGDG